MPAFGDVDVETYEMVRCFHARMQIYFKDSAHKPYKYYWNNEKVMVEVRRLDSSIDNEIPTTETWDITDVDHMKATATYLAWKGITAHLSEREIDSFDLYFD